jgi:transposase
VEDRCLGGFGSRGGGESRGEFPESYVPTEQEAQLRESVGTRQLLVKMRTQVCNRIRQLFAKHNEPMPNRGQLYSGPSLEALRRAELPGEWGTSLQMLVEGLDGVHEQVRGCELRLQE